MKQTAQSNRWTLFPEAFAVAAERWPHDGAPANPGAWLVDDAEGRLAELG